MSILLHSWLAATTKDAKAAGCDASRHRIILQPLAQLNLIQLFADQSEVLQHRRQQLRVWTALFDKTL